MKSAAKAGSQWILLLAVFVIATCGLVYELVAGTLASYLLGDSVTQFSTIIGVYLFSMGIGSFLSKYISGNLLSWFVRIELLVGLIGGFSAALLFWIFPVVASFRTVLYGLVGLTGILVGLEIPLLMRILQDRVAFKELVSRVFTFDYIGALIASLLFPMLLVPQLGLIRTSLLFGILNVGIGLYLCWYFKAELRNASALTITAIAALVIQLIGFGYAEQLLHASEVRMYPDEVVFATSSPYQRIILTRNKADLRLYLNGNLQFSSADEYRYHEALVHPVLSSLQDPQEVLVLGGGDGLAVREILKYPSVKHITLVDLDGEMTRLFRKQERLVRLNQGSLNHPKVQVINADAFAWLRQNQQQFDAAIVDFPDPSNFSVGKLYTDVFYRLLKRSLKPEGMAVIQSTSPYVAPKSYWCVAQTLQDAGFQTVPYHNYVPAFGDWGYLLAYRYPPPAWFAHLPSGLRYADVNTISGMLSFSKDQRVTTPLQINKLNNQALVQYFEEEWGRVE
jgi:spermidine synthase